MQVREAPRKNVPDRDQLEWGGLKEHTTHSKLFVGTTPNLVDALENGAIPNAAIPTAPVTMETLETILKGIETFKTNFSRIFTTRHEEDCLSVLALMQLTVDEGGAPCHWKAEDLRYLLSPRDHRRIDNPVVEEIGDSPPWDAKRGDFYIVKPESYLPFFLVEVVKAGRSIPSAEESPVWGAWVLYYWPKEWYESTGPERARIRATHADNLNYFLDSSWKAERVIPSVLPGDLDFVDLHSFQCKVFMTSTDRRYMKKIGGQDWNRNKATQWVTKWAGGEDMESSDDEPLA